VIADLAGDPDVHAAKIVGYDSEAALSGAFKKALGTVPATW
jgi:AraC-like DNA-binding protein